ncbi:MAG: helix-turn-helix domain-containing protein, partial [Clostridia bacterium]
KSKAPIRLKLFFSFYVFLMLPLLLLGVICMNWAFRSVTDNTLAVYTSTMENTGTRLNDAVESMTSVVNLFTQDPTISRLAHMRGNEVDYSRISLQQLQAYKSQLILHCTNSRLYDDVVICFPQKNCILSTLGIWQMKWFWEDEFHVLNMEAADIQAYMGQNATVPGLVVSNYGYAKRGTAFFRKGISSASGEALMCTLFWASESTLATHLRDLLLYPGCIVGVFDDRGQLITACNEQGILKDPSALTAAVHTSSAAQDTSVYQKLEWTHSPSGWQYVALVPQSAIHGKALEVQGWIMLIMAIVAVLGGFVSWELAVLNYRPLEHLFHTLGEYFKNEEGSSQNSMGKIEQKLLSVLREQEELRQSVNANKPLMQYAALTHLLEGGAPYHALAHQTSLNMLGIKMPYAHYRVAVAYCVADKEQAVGTARAACRGEAFRCYAVFQNELIVLLLNYQEHEQLHAFTSEVAPLCGALCLSAAHAHPQDFPKAYSEAQETLARRPVAPMSAACFFDELLPERLAWYPEEIEHQLLYEIFASNTAASVKLLEQILKKNDDVRMLHKLIVTLEMSLLKTDDGGGKLVEAMRALQKPNELDAEGGQAYARTLIEVAIAQRMSQTAVAHSELADQIMLYVDENICQPQLSLASTAESFSLSAAYLSRYFKETFGVGYLDYVNRKRVMLAKEMLTSGQCKVHEAAIRVGICNDATLRRLFKKYEGVVPSSLTEQV